MRGFKAFLTIVFWANFSTAAFGADVHRQLIVEIDPVAPISSNYETSQSGIATSKWGFNADFNIGGVISTGPEIWLGTFAVNGPNDEVTPVRREDFMYGESHKLDATRLRWNFVRWGMPSSMRGWYVKMGYSFTRINSRASRTIEETGDGDASPYNVFVAQPNDGKDLVSDIRHGATFGFGQRWLWFKNRISFTTGASITTNFKREINVDAKDPDTKADYESLIEELPDTKMTKRSFPEINLAMGFTF